MSASCSTSSIRPGSRRIPSSSTRATTVPTSTCGRKAERHRSGATRERLGKRHARALRHPLAWRAGRPRQQRHRRHDRLVAHAWPQRPVSRRRRVPQEGRANWRSATTRCISTATIRRRLFTGKSEQSTRNFVFYYDETVLTAIRYKQFKITFSAKFGGHWDDPLQSFGRPLITNLRMDPFERQWGDVNRQYAEHKTWVLTPIVGIVGQHLADL